MPLAGSTAACAGAVDLFDGAAVRRAVAGCQAVAHLATSVPTLTRAARPRSWSANDRLRAEATPLLVAAAIAAAASRFVMESIGFFYEDGGDRLLDETALVIENPITAATFAGERAALAIAAKGGHAVVLRFGLFYGANARMVDERLRVAWLLRLVTGRDVGYLAASQRVSSAKLEAATPWKPRYPSPREGWLQVARARRA